VLFTKPAQPGRVKTRLVGAVPSPAGRPWAVDAAGAADLHGAFLGDLVERLAAGGAGTHFHLRLAWDLEPGAPLPPPPPELVGLPRLDAVRQEGLDLGERLFHALATAAAEHAVVAALGSDHPALTTAPIERAFAAVGEAGRAEIALGPSEDGGYYLVALARRAVDRRLFTGIPWSTGGVLARTLERCRALGLTVECLPPARDVDRGEDLAALAADLAAGRCPDCPRTRRLLAAWGVLPTPAVQAAAG
jgi:glycosyltransferase A (GT-A) superfamily protein (DUF2064 family)